MRIDLNAVDPVVSNARQLMRHETDAVYGYKMSFQRLAPEQVEGRQKQVISEFKSAVQAQDPTALVRTMFVQSGEENILLVVMPHGVEGEPVRRTGIQQFGPPFFVHRRRRKANTLEG